MAIKYSNAPTATVLQYLQPVLIILWLSISQKQWPRRLDVISICFALVGTFYLVTGGHLHSLTLTPRALAWGLACGLAAALYVLIPRSLLQKYDSLIVCAIGMLISGIALSPVLLMMPWPKLSVTNWLIVAYIVIGGTMLAYPFFLQSTRYISPAVTSILGSFEPLIATVLAVTLLGTRLTVATVIGSLLILFTTFLQSIPLNRINFLIHRKGRG